MKGNLLLLQGGGPTAVINGSLYGALKAAQKSEKVHKIYAAKNGTGGLLKEELLDLTDTQEAELEKLLTSPGSAIGTSRDPLEKEDYQKMVAVLKKYEIAYVLLNGGNGTMDTCGKLYQMCEALETGIKVIGIPKTMDNDISMTDHSPGFGSAARYIAQSVKEVCCDVKGLPIHVVVIEASGRNTGWITAASALADETGEYAPDLIYLPEIAFDEQRFLTDVKEKLTKKTGIVVVVSEGLHDDKGDPIVPPIFSTGRATYFGDVSSHLANLIIRELGYKARGEKPGLLGRSSVALQSKVDLDEAVMAGKEAFRAVTTGQTGKMVAFRRSDSTAYQIESFLVAIEEVMLIEKKIPENYVNEAGNGVTQEFIDWCRPLLGESLPDMLSFN